MRTFRLILQVMLAVLGWVLMGLGWYFVVSTNPIHTHNVSGLVLLCVVAAIAIIFTNWWIGYNRDIYRRKGPRTHVPVAHYDYSVDVDGARIDADFSELKTERYIHISQEMRNGRHIKVYKASPPELSAEEMIACGR